MVSMAIEIRYSKVGSGTQKVQVLWCSFASNVLLVSIVVQSVLMNWE